MRKRKKRKRGRPTAPWGAVGRCSATLSSLDGELHGTPD